MQISNLSIPNMVISGFSRNHRLFTPLDSYLLFLVDLTNFPIIQLSNGAG